MDFSPDLNYRLSSLNDALTAPTRASLRPRWLSRVRRHQTRQKERHALLRWRALRDFFLSAGVDPLPARLGVVDAAPSFYWHGLTGARIWLPTDKSFVPALAEGAGSLYSQAILLLHEWGHALLHPQADTAWVNHLVGPAREHAHPAWAQVGEYSGWRVFNEMFADAFSAAWLLNLSGRSPRALSALTSLRRARHHTAQNFNHIHFPCHHQTADVLDRVMAEQWSGETENFLPRLVKMCSDSFQDWYEFSSIPGKDICSSSRSHMLFLDREFSDVRRSISLRGRSWRSLGQPANPHSQRLMEMLYAENPGHFLWKLRAVSSVMNFSFPSDSFVESTPSPR